MSSPIGLLNWTFGPLLLTDRGYWTSAFYDVQPSVCTRCSSAGRLQHWGKVSINVRDIPHLGLPMEIEVTRTRFMCLDCRRTFVQPLPDIHERHLLTKRAVQYITIRAMETASLTDLAHDIGVDERTVREIIYDHVANLEGKSSIVTPAFLGIGDVRIAGSRRSVFADLIKQEIVDLIISRQRRLVVQWLRTRVEGELVQAVMISPLLLYRTAVQEALGSKISIVLSKRRVLQAADEGLDAVRRLVMEQAGLRGRQYVARGRGLLLKPSAGLNSEERSKVLKLIQVSPMLSAAYDAKEALSCIYNEQDRAKAEKIFEAWTQRLQGDLRIPFKYLINLSTNWRTEILEYWSHRSQLASVLEPSTLFASCKQRQEHSFRIARARTLYRGRDEHLNTNACCDTCGASFPLKLLQHRHIAPLVPQKVQTQSNGLVVCDKCHQRLFSQQ